MKSFICTPQPLDEMIDLLKVWMNGLVSRNCSMLMFQRTLNQKKFGPWEIMLYRLHGQMDFVRLSLQVSYVVFKNFLMSFAFGMAAPQMAEDFRKMIWIIIQMKLFFDRNWAIEDP
ncbi:Hypothetical predicted protein [Olea europaea subsp. europaea]|uniref:Uncharacterized protein n=1 Tax=Olea europaea subsp. europaea TaxID=158383 RepID=A0A8S0SNK2_OLEEU|nr:Hypothetical predicted protein [Olea europaea subsp. europaea]